MHEVKVVALLEDPILESPAEALEVPVVDVEHVALHLGGRKTPEDLRLRLLDAGPVDVTDASESDQ